MAKKRNPKTTRKENAEKGAPKQKSRARESSTSPAAEKEDLSGTTAEPVAGNNDAEDRGAPAGKGEGSGTADADGKGSAAGTPAGSSQKITLHIYGPEYEDELQFIAGNYTTYAKVDGGVKLFENAIKIFNSIIEYFDVKKEEVEGEREIGRKIEIGIPGKEERKKGRVKTLFADRVHPSPRNPRAEEFSELKIFPFDKLKDIFNKEEGSNSSTHIRPNFHLGVRATLVHCPQCGERQFEDKMRGMRIPGVGSVFNAALIYGLAHFGEDIAKDPRALMAALAVARFYRREWPGEQLQKGKNNVFEKINESIKNLENKKCCVENTLKNNGKGDLRHLFYGPAAKRTNAGNWMYIADYADKNFSLSGSNFAGYIFFRLSRAGVKSSLFEKLTERICKKKNQGSRKNENCCSVQSGEGSEQLRDRLTIITKARTLRELGLPINEFAAEKAIDDLLEAIPRSLRRLVERCARKGSSASLDNYEVKNGDDHLAVLLLNARRVIIRFDLEGVVVLELTELSSEADGGNGKANQNAVNQDAYLRLQLKETCEPLACTVPHAAAEDDGQSIVMHALTACYELKMREAPMQGSDYSELRQ